MCVCDKGEKGGWWIFEIFQRELKLRNVSTEMFANRLMVSSQDMIFKDEDINMFYNVADVGISTADGEGFGLCQFEQMGVGVRSFFSIQISVPLLRRRQRRLCRRIRGRRQRFALLSVWKRRRLKCLRNRFC